MSEDRWDVAGCIVFVLGFFLAIVLLATIVRTAVQ